MKSYGILAHPVKHSSSPAIFNAAFKALSVDAEYRVFDILEEDLSSFMDSVRHDPVNGLSVSLPHKETVRLYLDDVHEDARALGAVNTVVNRGGFLHGYNTDFIGSNKALTEVVGSLRGHRATVIGAGGAARAVVYGLLKSGASVSILNRHKEKAEALAKEFGKMFDVEIFYDDVGDQKDSSGGDILVNATSIWTLNPDADLEDLVPKNFVKNFRIVMDIIYKPLMTPLLIAAKDFGNEIITGDKMLLYQAVEQFKLFTDKEAPLAVMRDTLNKLVV